MQVNRVGHKRILRDLNRTLAFRIIAEEGPISRTGVARRAGLTASTVTHIVTDFIRAGLVSEVTPEGFSRPAAGRPPVMLKLNPEAGCLVGIKLRDSSVIAVLCDLSCGVIADLEIHFTVRPTPEHAVAVMAEAVDRLIVKAAVPRSYIIGVGVGVPGLVDADREMCSFSPILGWRDAPLGAALSEALSMPVWIENVVNALAMGQARFGAGRDVSEFLMVTIGQRIGLSVVVDGRVYRGVRGAANNFGHTTVDASPSAPFCNCGKGAGAQCGFDCLMPCRDLMP